MDWNLNSDTLTVEGKTQSENIPQLKEENQLLFPETLNPKKMPQNHHFCHHPTKQLDQVIIPLGVNIIGMCTLCATPLVVLGRSSLMLLLQRSHVRDRSTNSSPDILTRKLSPTRHFLATRPTCCAHRSHGFLRPRLSVLLGTTCLTTRQGFRGWRLRDFFGFRHKVFSGNSFFKIILQKYFPDIFVFYKKNISSTYIFSDFSCFQEIILPC